MKQIIKLSMIASVVSLIIGCATNSDIENIQSQIDGLKLSVAQVSTDVQCVSEAIQKAAASADSVLKHSEAAAQLAHGADLKIDALFTQTMKK